jgi:hypothetical protein
MLTASLASPPICLLTLYVVEDAGTPHEREREWDNYACVRTPCAERAAR